MMLPALLGTAVMVNWVDVPPELEDAFTEWHTHEHMPERVAIPGFRRGRRFVRTGPRPHDPGKYLTIYETADLEVLRSAAYLARLNDPTAQTTRMVSSLSYFSRAVCRVTTSAGHGTAGNVATIEFGPTDLQVTAVREWLAEAFAALRASHHVVAAHLFESDPEVTNAKDQTAEGTQTAAAHTLRWMVLAELTDKGRADPVHTALCGPASLLRMGIDDLTFRTFETMSELLFRPGNNPQELT